MMDIGMLAKDVTALVVPLMPYLVKAGEKAAEVVAQEIGKDGWDKAKTLWQRLWQGREGREAVRKAVQEVIDHPKDEDAVAALRLQIRKILAEDASLAREIKELLEELRHVTPQHFQARLEGSGAIAQGKGAVAAGAGGVAIGGNVQGGNIITGSNNTFGRKREKEGDDR
jgi:hypothetical protein